VIRRLSSVFVSVFARAAFSRLPCHCHCLPLPLPCPCSYILDTLLRHGLVSDAVAASVKQFIADNQTDKPGAIPAQAAAAPQPKRCAPLPGCRCSGCRLARGAAACMVALGVGDNGLQTYASGALVPAVGIVCICALFAWHWIKLLERHPSGRNGSG
jgi:hypothetical protein